MPNVSEGEKWSLWPDHWSGGWGEFAEPINRIRIDHGRGTVAFVEHHGTGSGNNKYPTKEDYDRAVLMAEAPAMLRLLRLIQKHWEGRAGGAAWYESVCNFLDYIDRKSEANSSKGPADK